ncbi:MAG: hypothetical protein QN168_13785 [Armatimonadota bacterium]|nr:hypothetical protein [Armatimonadota bacterium]
MTTFSLIRLILAITFAGAVAITVLQHVNYATGRRPREFFAFLETSGWLVLSLASGIALFRLAPWLLSASTAVVGVLFVLVGALLRAPDHA